MMRMNVSYTIRLIAPSGYCHNQLAAARGIACLQQAGHKVEHTDIVTRRFQRFAGTDAERLHDINALTEESPRPDILLAVRGGYGATRLLQQIDYPPLQQCLQYQPIALCGHSDFTALQLALLAQSQLITFSSPMLCSHFGAEVLSPFTLQHFWLALTSPLFKLSWCCHENDLSPLQGLLWGGNLSMITALAGTPYLPRIKGGILVIEDINEPPYRIERMLQQLLQCGILATQQAIIVGCFSGTKESEYDQGFGLNSIWQRLRELTRLPIITGLSFGHGIDTVTLPQGAQGTLFVSRQRATLTVTGHPTLPH